METKRLSGFLNGLATALVALFFALVLHEFLHMAYGLLTGMEVRAFNLFAVDVVRYGDEAHRFADLLMEAGPSLTNAVLGLVSLCVLRCRKLSSLARQFTLQLMGYNMLMGFGYMMIDALIYSPGAAGDWKSVLDMYNGSLALRIPLGIVGVAGVLFTYFRLAYEIYSFVDDPDSKEQRRAAAARIYLVPYIVWGVVYTILGIWHPLEMNGFIINAMMVIMGFCGFLWAFLFSVHWLKPPKKLPPKTALVLKPSIPWLVISALILIFEAAVLLPTVYFK
ncbi:MAG: hypothetical protein ACOX75_08210 [Lachnospiraceae bacterium]|jgi:hypothetical protein